MTHFVKPILYIKQLLYLRKYYLWKQQREWIFPMRWLFNRVNIVRSAHATLFKISDTNEQLNWEDVKWINQEQIIHGIQIVYTH